MTTSPRLLPSTAFNNIALSCLLGLQNLLSLIIPGSPTVPRTSRGRRSRKASTALRIDHTRRSSLYDPTYPEPPKIRLLIGRDAVEFTTNANLLRVYSHFFASQPASQNLTFEFRNLTPTGVATTLRILVSLHSGSSGWDSHTIRYPHDVFQCADMWGLQEVKTQVHTVLADRDFDPHRTITDYEAFLNQLYQFFIMYTDSEMGDIALTTCLKTLQRDHDKICTNVAMHLNQRDLNLPHRERIYGILMAEFARLRGECECQFCVEQRQWKADRLKKMTVLKLWWQILYIEYQWTKRIAIDVALLIWGWLFSRDMALALLLVTPLIGSAVLINGLTYVFGTVLGFYISMGACLISVASMVSMWVLALQGHRFFTRLRNLLLRLWPRMFVVTALFYAVIAMTAWWAVTSVYAALREADLQNWMDRITFVDYLEPDDGQDA
ncbi:hypothetical protein Dda_6368 [Drechslerella dactyloides]|uniref:Uncharacterized protein n=1 Tax=Drechslerella dactyloides TaxID=74499 RepID=A0AAD6ITQ2_DREDA|nr:hypothetical protein Dda_6368 [Drechslerella dactyloides]